MPTYQYACTDPACDHRFEQFQSFTDPALTECPVCSGRLRKVYGSVGVVFKGSGFYRNDSRAEANGAKKKNQDKESSASSSSDSSSSTAGKDTASNKDSSPTSSGKDSSAGPAEKSSAKPVSSSTSSASSSNS